MKIRIKTYTGYIIKPVKDIRVFFNKDCMKYGVEVLGNLWDDAVMGERWQMIALNTKTKAYTPYKKVAERWKREFIVEE